ncbi:MAG TPA: 16S rRNA (guanine(527)-N(7))-methyltransferase RsmG, partial [Clostridiales bacterium]|nr:16S rRNA (guanine(527)-N(7))-methyltransferase RsmG [Clostridiales bacterium]
MIRQIFSENGIFLKGEQVEKFLTYEKLLTEYNKKFNLTSITDSYGIYV